MKGGIRRHKSHLIVIKIFMYDDEISERDHPELCPAEFAFVRQFAAVSALFHGENEQETSVAWAD
jgi:hypothetical protein